MFTLSRKNKLKNSLPFYLLYGQSTLIKFKIKFEILEEIAPYILQTKPLKKGQGQIITPISGCEVYVEQIQDICEKLDFLRVCMRTVQLLEKHIDDGVFVFHVEETKFFFYTFVYNLKALMDSISMLLREIFKLYSFTKGNIDIVRKEQYKKEVFQLSPDINDFFLENENWIKKLLDFRDRLIHRNRIPIFIKDKDSHSVFWIQYIDSSKEGTHYHVLTLAEEKMPVLSFKDNKIGLKKPFTYVYYKKPITLQEILKKAHSSSDFFSILDFCSNSFDLSIKLIKIIFGELYSKLTTT